MDGEFIEINGVRINVLAKQAIDDIACTEGLIVVCQRCEDGPPAIPAGGKGMCGKCRRDVWVAPATQAAMPVEAKIRCVQCAMEDVQEN